MSLALDGYVRNNIASCMHATIACMNCTHKLLQVDECFVVSLQMQFKINSW